MMKGEIENRIAALSHEKRALLELRLNGRAGGPARPETASHEELGDTAASEVGTPELTQQQAFKSLDFSLFFFSGDGANAGPDKYHLLMECAKFADANGFTAVWTPERHFKPFGGLYPNPSVIAAALSMLTTRVQLRAGSVVLPLHQPLRVVEEWAVVDNLSNGRVAIAFASGWLADDFVLAPERYASRKELMFREIQTILKLWRGQHICMPNGSGNETSVRVYPNPVQSELPIWITATHRKTFIEAGKIGANVLTGLMEQSLEQCADCIKAYREARADNGYDPSDGRVAVMLHTYLGDDEQHVKEVVRSPFREYLRSYLRMTKEPSSTEPPQSTDDLSTEEQDTLLDIAFERYFYSSALLGTPESCDRMVRALKKIDVDEVACLLDFGLDNETVLNGLHKLKEVMYANSFTESRAAT